MAKPLADLLQKVLPYVVQAARAQAAQEVFEIQLRQQAKIAAHSMRCDSK